MVLITDGRVIVDGRIIQNPNARVPADASIVIRPEGVLKGTHKLGVAMASSGVDPKGAICLDVGASTGGFTTALLDRGAALVYAVDVGYGQLRGALARDRRVINLERTNVADLDRMLVPDVVDLATIDLSYLSLAEALPQLVRVSFAPTADLIALVKRAFELRMGVAARDPDEIDKAVELASAAAEETGWPLVESIPSPVLGKGRSREVFIHARGASRDNHPDRR